METPHWSSTRNDRRLWIDVRPELGPLGQVLRELKVLRDYTPYNTDIAVLCKDEDDLAEEILRNERFILIDEAYLSGL